MKTSAVDLLDPVQGLDYPTPSHKSPSPTVDDKADKEIDSHAAQDTQSGVANELLLKNSSLRVKLDTLSGFRIHTDTITFVQSEWHGYGGKAEVVKATLKRGDGSDEQQVAVKKPRYYDGMNERKFGNEFVHEVDVMAQLSHENIVRLIGFVEDLEKGKAWIVLSWEPNGNISEFLATGEWEIPERISLIQDTFAGINYLHTRQRPICHGDLKSLNILVSASYRAVITDFGSARILMESEDAQADRGKVLDAAGASAIAPAIDERIDRAPVTIVAGSNQLTLTGPACSLRWAAPEVALGEPQSLASDIWAAGWICWEVMTNKVPFPELNSEGVIALKIVEGKVPVVREDAQLSQVIRLCSLMTDCWAFVPQNRPHIARCWDELKRMPSMPPRTGTTSDSNAPSAELLCVMGLTCQSQQSYQKAISLFQQALSIAMSTGNESTCAEALLGVGKSYYLTSKDGQAKQCFTQAQDIYAKIGDRCGEANTLYWMANIYRAQSQLTEAEKLYIQARDIYHRIGNAKGRAMALRGLGSIFHKRSQYSEAQASYNQARDIYVRIGDDRGQANTLRRLGALCNERDDHVKAEECLNQALAIYSRIGDEGGRGDVLARLGELFHVQGLNTKAAPLFVEARSSFAQIGHSKWEKHCSKRLDVVSKHGESSAT